MSEDFGKDLAKEFVSQTAGKTYDDIAHPTANATGQLISFIPRTIQVWLRKWEKWIINGEYSIKETKKLLEKKLANIAEDKISEPESYVAVPALQQLSYSLDSEELREMYANLLASSMNIDTKANVHPAFVDIIKQLTPDEAKLLKRISLNDDEYPLISIHKVNPDRSFNEVMRHFSDIAFEACENPLNIYSYLDNLERLKLIEIPYDGYLTDEKVYDPLKNHEIVKNITSQILPEGHHWDFAKKYFFLTAFGKHFVSVYLP